MTCTCFACLEEDGLGADLPRSVPPSLTVSVPEAGQMLGLKRNAAYAAARRGDIPALRFGRRIRVSRAAVMAMVNARLPPAGPSPHAADHQRLHRGLAAVGWLLALDPKRESAAPLAPVALRDLALVWQQLWETLGPEVDLREWLLVVRRQITDT